MLSPTKNYEWWEFAEGIEEKYGEDHGFRFEHYQFQQSRQAVQQLSMKKLKERLNHQNPYLKEIALLELERREIKRRMDDTEIGIIKSLPTIAPATLSETAIKVKIFVDYNEYYPLGDLGANITYCVKEWWISCENNEDSSDAIAFSHNIPDEIDEDEAKEWLALLRDNLGGFEPAKGILDGMRLIIFDTPYAHFESYTDKYQIEFAHLPEQ